MSYTDLFSELLRAEIELWNSLDRRLHAVEGVSLPTFQALSAIEKLASPARVQDISEVMSITVGAASKVVDRLEREGLVERSSNPDDRRSSIIAITDPGAQTLSRAAATAEEHLHSMLSRSYPVSRTKALTAELSSLRAAISNTVIS